MYTCKNENFHELSEAVKLIFERYDERNAIHTELNTNCLYNLCQRNYVVEDEVPGVYRLNSIKMEKRFILK